MKRELLILAMLLSCVLPAFASDADNAQWNQAQQLYQSGDYTRALPALTALDKAFPSNVKLHYMIGMCCKNLGKQAQAQRAELGFLIRTRCVVETSGVHCTI